MKTSEAGPGAGPEWLDGPRRGIERTSLVLLVLGVLMPAVAIAQPAQPFRAVAAASLLMLLPGLAVARLMRPEDPFLFVLVAVASSLALTVLTSTLLMYLGIWSWQLTLVLLGLVTAATARSAAMSGEPT